MKTFFTKNIVPFSLSKEMALLKVSKNVTDVAAITVKPRIRIFLNDKLTGFCLRTMKRKRINPLPVTAAAAAAAAASYQTL